MARLEPAPDVSATDWIVAGLKTFGRSVVGLVPEGFPAYVRVFHPAYRLDLGSPQPWLNRSTVSWAEIAAANGRTPHAGMQLPAVTGDYRFLHQKQPSVYDRPPLEGSLPAEVVSELVDVLSRNTRTPDNCWFAVWNGFGSTRDDVRRAPLFNVPARGYFLLHGSVDAVRENVLDEPWRQSPNIWWPDDHAWCVATEIDLNTTYIGCASDCCHDILASPLEALTIDSSAGITWDSDGINPDPRRDPSSD